MFSFDLENGDMIFGSGDNRFDSDSYIMHHMVGNLVMAMDTGDFI